MTLHAEPLEYCDPTERGGDNKLKTQSEEKEDKLGMRVLRTEECEEFQIFLAANFTTRNRVTGCEALGRGIISPVLLRSRLGLVLDTRVFPPSFVPTLAEQAPSIPDHAVCLLRPPLSSAQSIFSSI